MRLRSTIKPVFTVATRDVSTLHPMGGVTFTPEKRVSHSREMGGQAEAFKTMPPKKCTVDYVIEVIVGRELTPEEREVSEQGARWRRASRLGKKG